jgi:hypothetical protein
LTRDTAKYIKQGDDFLKQIVPVIMASNACEDGGVIAANAKNTFGAKPKSRKLVRLRTSAVSEILTDECDRATGRNDSRGCRCVPSSRPYF